LRHRDAWAEEKRAPLTDEPTLLKEETVSENEVLVVASKVKSYIKEKSEMNTSAAVMQALSDRIRQLVDQAIERARQDGRKTVMDRDFQ
jgi:histone H3/H4